MNAFKTIILTTDFSETSRKAVAPARMLAKVFGAKLLLFHAGDHVPPGLWEYPGLDVQAMEDRQLKVAREQLKRFAAANLKNIKRVEPIVVLGDAHAEIVQLAEERGADLIVMATHGRNFFSHAVMGSTTERVLRRSPCPVLAVRDAGTKDAWFAGATASSPPKRTRRRAK